MATAVASRFAVLSIDDDDDIPKKSQPKKKTDTKKQGSATSNQTNANKKKNNKKLEAGNKTSQQNNTSNKSKGKTGSKSEPNKDNTHKKKGNTVAAQDQWDQWKKKDVELADCTFEQDMHQAILLSKLDYEQKKDVYEQARKFAEEEKKQQGPKKSKKANKPQTMSLEEFNTRQSESPISEGDSFPTRESLVSPDFSFFERIKDDAKKVLTKEQEGEKRKTREPLSQESITVAQLEDSLEKKNQENKVLKEEIVKLKEELHNVRSRNKKLCNILAQGEMKDKAAVLEEVDSLQQMRDELSSEVSSLHAQLEQERSKVRSLTADSKGKSQNKKRSTSETNQA